MSQSIPYGKTKERGSTTSNFLKCFFKVDILYLLMIHLSPLKLLRGTR